jgi:hypothetical protein
MEELVITWYRLEGGSKKGRSCVGVVRLRGLVVSDPLLLVLLIILGSRRACTFLL